MNNSIKKATASIKLSGDTIKIIAVIAMIVDHGGYSLLRYYLATYYMDILPQTYTKLNNLYEACRNLGRIAFPIFAFFLVEGYFRTHNIKKYALRLGIFAILTEIPFDLALYRKPFEFSHQNVMFELLLGLLMLILFNYIENITGLSLSVRWICIISAVIGFADLAHICKLDYNIKGIVLIAILYLFRSSGVFSLIAGAAAISIEKFAPISFVLLYFYDPDIKPRFKYFFYLFYPVHLLVLYQLATLLFQ